MNDKFLNKKILSKKGKIMRKIILLCLASVLIIVNSVTAADKVVVVPLNSTRINKQQTLTYQRFTLMFPGKDDYVSYVMYCATNGNDGSAGYIPLNLPVGAEIVSVSAAIYDGSSSTPYSVSLRKDIVEINYTELYYATLSTVSGGDNSMTIVQKDITPATAETVDDGEYFYLYFSPGAASANGFCGAQVTIKGP